MIANSFVLYAYLKCFLSVICGNLRIWVKSSSTCGNLVGAVWSNLSHSFSFFWDKALRVGDKKTESLTVTNEKWIPEVGVELCDQCWREGLNVWHQGSRNMPLQVSMSPSPSQRTGSVSPVQTIRRFSRTLKLPLVLFTLAFCTSVWSLGLFSATALQMNALVLVAGLHRTEPGQGRSKLLTASRENKYFPAPCALWVFSSSCHRKACQWANLHVRPINCEMHTQ